MATVKWTVREEALAMLVKSLATALAPALGNALMEEGRRDRLPPHVPQKLLSLARIWEGIVVTPVPAQTIMWWTTSALGAKVISAAWACHSRRQNVRPQEENVETAVNAKSQCCITSVPHSLTVSSAALKRNQRSVMMSVQR